MLGIRQVNLGQYLTGGDPVVPLQSLDPIYVNFGVPQQGAGQMRVGRTVRVTAADRRGAEFSGRVTAVDSVVDQATRNVQVQATLANPGASCVRACSSRRRCCSAQQSVIALPASAISYAPYGDSVFVVTDLKDPKGETVSRRAPAGGQAGGGAAAIRWRCSPASSRERRS